MKLEQKQTLSHRLALTQSMRQSLQCLQFSAIELNEFAQEEALSNPLLNVQSASFLDTLPISDIVPPVSFSGADSYERDFSSFRAESAEAASYDAFLSSPQHFSDYLCAQIGQMRLVDDELLAMCRYLIGCLDSRGYLDCPLADLAAEYGCTAVEMEQALFALQMLDPPGVGARDLSECLILQLSQGSDFDRLTLAIARDGLSLLGRRDYSGLAAMLGVPLRDARQAAQKVLALNPIPARGFSDSRENACIVPDAEFRMENGALQVELNQKAMPVVTIQEDYIAILAQTEDSEAQKYIREKLSEANLLIKNMNLRGEMLLRIMTYVAEKQFAFFRGGEIAPVTMHQTAKDLEVNVSTVSRAVQNKYIQFDHRVLPLRDFFSVAVRSETEGGISSQAVRQRVQYLIRSEDKTSPLSDEAIAQALAASGITISRRAVAAHRTALGFPPAGKRKSVS